MLERGINHFDSGSYLEAKSYLEEVERVDPDSDFGQEATNYLLQIEEKLAPKEEVEENDDNGWW